MPDFEPKNPPETLLDLAALERGWSAQSARQYVIGWGLVFAYPTSLYCVALATGKDHTYSGASVLFSQAFLICVIWLFRDLRDKEHPLGPALKPGFVNEAIPPEEANFLCRIARAAALMAVMAWIEACAIGVWVGSAYFGSPRKDENLHYLLGATLVCPLVFVYFKRSTARIRADWDRYVAARDDKNLSV